MTTRLKGRSFFASSTQGHAWATPAPRRHCERPRRHELPGRFDGAEGGGSLPVCRRDRQPGSHRVTRRRLRGDRRNEGNTGVAMKRETRTLRELIGAAALALLAAAVVRELSLPRDQRTWHGTMCGVPYDLRQTDVASGPGELVGTPGPPPGDTSGPRCRLGPEPGADRGPQQGEVAQGPRPDQLTWRTAAPVNAPSARSVSARSASSNP